MSARHAGLLAYLMLLLLAAMIWAGVTKPSDGLWCVAFATMLFAASVDGRRMAETENTGSVRSTTSAVGAAETHNLTPHPKGQTRSNKSRPVT